MGEVIGREPKMNIEEIKKRLNTSTRRLRFFPGHRVFGNCYEKIASKRPSKRDRNFDQIHARKSKNACSLSNCILILTPGGATPTYDEPVDTASEPDMNSPIEQYKDRSSAEEGECNDDGVELKPSLRIMNLPSPDRKSKEEEEPVRKSPKKSVVSLRRVIDSPNENFATEKKEEMNEKDSGSEQEPK